MSDGKIFVAYTDGSTRPTNPGFSGCGVYGYTLIPAKRPTKVKHPIKNKLYFTTAGITEEPDVDPYETVEIVESIRGICGPTGTNNLAELMAFITALELATTLNVSKVIVLTDSSYVVNNYNDNLKKWKDNNWNRADGNPIANKALWCILDEMSSRFESENIQIELRWIKGHADNYGNETADLYAGIGANYAKKEYETNLADFQTNAYTAVSSYKDYKDSLADKDIIYYFRDLFFSSSNLDDTNYCFLSTSTDVSMLGKRDIASIFLTNVGYVPSVINDVKRIFREISRNYVINCCVKLNRLEDRELARLARLVGIDKMVRLVQHHTGPQLYLINDTSPFVMEYTHDFPFIVEASTVFNNTLDVLTKDTSDATIIKRDVTDIFVKEGKLAFNNNDKNIDLSHIFSDSYTIVNSLHVVVGSDLPNYLALKSIESDIKKVTAITELRPDSNYLSLYIAIETSDRVLCSVNIVNKFLVRR